MTLSVNDERCVSAITLAVAEFAEQPGGLEALRQLPDALGQLYKTAADGADGRRLGEVSGGGELQTGSSARPPTSTSV